MFGKDCCKIARFVGCKTCTQVAEVMGDEIIADSPQDDEASATALKSFSRRKRPGGRHAHPRKVSICGRDAEEQMHKQAGCRLSFWHSSIGLMPELLLAGPKCIFADPEKC